MSRTRFGLLVGVLAVLAAGASFAAATRLLDDGRPAAPPGAGTSTDDDATDDTTAPTPTAPISTEPLATPAWIAVIASEPGDTGETSAREIAGQVAAAGHEASILRSDDYPSMRAGFWVAYAGPYADAPAASEAVNGLRAEGWTGAYVRCAGSAAECPSAPDPDNGNGNGNGNGGDDDDDDDDDD